MIIFSTLVFGVMFEGYIHRCHPDQTSQLKEAKLNFQREVAQRKDLRELRIFTIDPATAKDLDDAIHVIPGGFQDRNPA